jgi:hypothetical protein
MAKKKKKSYRPNIFLLILLIPLSMLIAWAVWPRKKLVIAIIDKTVLTNEGQEHSSLSWILNNERYTKTETDLYDVESDYYGFFPKDSNKYELKGLERLSPTQIEKLSNDADLVYFTDAYGIYSNEWFKKGRTSDRSGLLYGGMHRNDVELMKRMKAQKKMVIAEFNCLGSPTKPGVDTAFTELFKVEWTGWIGRYFETFDTTSNKEIPRWLISYYVKQSGKKWAFTKPGIALLNKDNRVVILEKDIDLTNEFPEIHSTQHAQDYYHLPEKFNYSFWFEILRNDTSVNRVLSTMHLRTTKKGLQQLQNAGVPSNFPAVMRHNGDDYKFWYFAADFCDNPLSMAASRFKGIQFFQTFFYNHYDEADRKKFFWKFYRPLLTKLLDDYYNTLRQN